MLRRTVSESSSGKINLFFVTVRLYKFIYTDEAHLTDENLPSVLSLADKYLVTDLFARCVQHVKTANVCRFLPLTAL